MFLVSPQRRDDVLLQIANAGIGSQGMEADPPAADGGDVKPTRRLVASLGSRPKTLHDLWVKCSVGTSGKKPARDSVIVSKGKSRVCTAFASNSGRSATN